MYIGSCIPVNNNVTSGNQIINLGILSRALNGFVNCKKR
jgi:hypothetical protein